MATVDIRIDEKLIFFQKIDSHSFNVSDDGKTVTVTLEMTDALETPDVDGIDPDEVYARLQAEGAPTGLEGDPRTGEDAVASGEAALGGGVYNPDESPVETGNDERAAEAPGNDDATTGGAEADPDSVDPSDAASQGDHDADEEQPENEPGSAAVADEDSGVSAEDTTDSTGGEKAKKGRRNS